MFCDHRYQPISRRDALTNLCAGFGSIALAGLLAREATAGGGVLPSPHFRPRAKRVIFLFMHGGPSQVDTFDYKPLLARDHGKPLPFAKPRVQFAETGNLLASPWKFRQYGESGAWVSDLFPNVAQVVDDCCFIKSLHGSNPAHGGALLKIHTGSDTFIRPSMGAWASYGLGTENDNLPAFITICPTLGHGGVNNFSSGFLPAWTHGTPIGHAGVPASRSQFEHMQAGLPPELQRKELDFLQELNAQHMARNGSDAALEGRIESFELAYRMQSAAPAVMDLNGESEATKKLYGMDEKKTEDFGTQCLLARRFAQAGVRFVQCTHSYKWDQHGDLRSGHTTNAAEVDKPIAGLIRDLKAHGMLEDTLVLWGGEFGRTPTAQGGDGRDHNPHGFTMFMAGGGVKAGFSYGETDDYGYYAAVDKVDVHDLHATILALLGVDHERLTFRHGGRDHRLTDVSGKVVTSIFA
ncbi:MAG: DUF1501 domain-containing protein [Planctomycetota bacterium]|nr:MAG: DUF1501 domain-containing protein [Planctomycetota bacterium]